MFWLEIKIKVLIMYCYSNNERVDYEALAIPGTSGESKCMLQLPISDSQLHQSSRYMGVK